MEHTPRLETSPPGGGTLEVAENIDRLRECERYTTPDAE
jgi:hypothetical protein